MWFELERGQHCTPHVANPPWASEHQGHTGARSGREFGKAAGTGPPGLEGTCGEGDRTITGVEVIEKPALNRTFFVFVFLKTKAAGPSEDPSVNFLKNVGESVAAALSPLGKWRPLSFESRSVSITR